MKRRSFLFKSSVFGSAVLFPPLISEKSSSISVNNQDNNKELIDKVKTAMLSMQKASWEQGVAAQAFLELGDFDMAVMMARESVLRQADDGRLSVVYYDNGVTDPAASGEPVLYAAKITGDENLKNAANRMLKYLLDKAPKSKSGILYHTLNAKQIWVDALYMAPPFLAAAGAYNEAIKQIDGIRAALWDPSNKLFSHIWDDDKQAFKNKNFWGVGNGWAVSGITRVIRYLPPEMSSEKDKLITYVKDTIDGCLKHIRDDGLFHNVVDDRNTFIETNLSQMLAYSIFSGTKDDWLEKGYLEYAYKMRDAVYNKVDKYGYIQDVCGAPHFDRPGRAVEGQAFFLLMESAYKKLNK